MGLDTIANKIQNFFYFPTPKKLTEQEMKDQVALIRSVGVDSYLEAMLHNPKGFEFPLLKERYGDVATRCTWGSLFMAAIEEIRELKNEQAKIITFKERHHGS